MRKTHDMLLRTMVAFLTAGALLFNAMPLAAATVAEETEVVADESAVTDEKAAMDESKGAEAEAAADETMGVDGEAAAEESAVDEAEAAPEESEAENADELAANETEAAAESLEASETAGQDVDAEPAGQDADIEPAGQDADAEAVGQDASAGDAGQNIDAETAGQDADAETETVGQGSGTEAESDSVAESEAALMYWAEDSAARQSIEEYVSEITDESSESFVPEEDRIVVFDFDGTLFGELFPTYFDRTLFLHRALHDDSYEAPEEIRELAAELEDIVINGANGRETPSGSKPAARVFEGMTIDEYRAYVREFMGNPVNGFDGMTYEDGFYLPMVSLVEYLSENGFSIYISSGSERNLLREAVTGKLDKWIPADHIIGSTYGMAATKQEGSSGADYNLLPDDKIVMTGELLTKNKKTNKVTGIINEIGKVPILAFGNSADDIAMAQYAVGNEKYEGRAYFLLCDDMEREYGNLNKADSLRESCEERGFYTVSMKDDFATIYGEDVEKTSYKAVEDVSVEIDEIINIFVELFQNAPYLEDFLNSADWGKILMPAA